MQKPVQRMTLQEFRDELGWTWAAWDAANLDGVLAGGQPPALGERASGHQLVAQELLRRPSNCRAPPSAMALTGFGAVHISTESVLGMMRVTKQVVATQVMTAVKYPGEWEQGCTRVPASPSSAEA